MADSPAVHRIAQNRRQPLNSLGHLAVCKVVCVVPQISSPDELVSRAALLAERGTRTLLGLSGAPGAGKSTVAALLAAALGDRCAMVPMDGFHLAQDELVRLGRADRKGAIDTFDGYGFVALLRRLARADEPIVYAPTFRRDLEEPIAGSIGVPASVPLVITEGNYLLFDVAPWTDVRGLLHEVWFIRPEDDVRRERLVARHVAFGRSPAAARAWALGTDERNAELVVASAHKADLIVTVAGTT